MSMLAPIVIAYLGEARRSEGLDADGDGGILDDLAERGGGILGSLFGKR